MSDDRESLEKSIAEGISRPIADVAIAVALLARCLAAHPGVNARLLARQLMQLSKRSPRDSVSYTVFSPLLMPCATKLSAGR